jgi:hypothetical protein
MFNYLLKSQIELYSDTGFEIIPTDLEMHLLAQMPKDKLVPYLDMLVLIGDLLISTGTRLKNSAQLDINPSQETL